MSEPPPELDRYSRQVRFPHIGQDGQEQLAQGRVVIIGCGALGSVIANTLVRAGVGFVRIVDRDFLELSNLQRQVLFNEDDVASGLPKAIAAAQHLRAINSDVVVDPVVADVTAANVESLCESMDVILDGSDNFEIRFLINDVAVRHSIPWIYGGCLGADGQTMTIIPHQSACLHCLMLNGPPPPGTTETCDSFGILSPIINVIASIESMEAIKLLTGSTDQVSRKLQMFSLWSNETRSIDVSNLRERVDCPTCQQGKFEWLEGKRGAQSVILCGRNAVQLSFADRSEIDLVGLGERLASADEVTVELSNEYLLRFRVSDYSITVFEDGRAVVTGTDDASIARKLYAQWIGQ